MGARPLPGKLLGKCWDACSKTAGICSAIPAINGSINFTKLQARKLADQIIESQRREIAEMRMLIAELKNQR